MSPFLSQSILFIALLSIFHMPMEFRQSVPIPTSISGHHKDMADDTLKPQNKIEDLGNCGLMSSADALSKFEEERHETFVHNNYSVLTNNVTIVLDGCFYCPFMINYVIKSFEIWQYEKEPFKTKYFNFQLSKQRVNFTGEDFAVVKTVYLAEDPFNNHVFFVIQHNCTELFQTTWQYIEVDNWWSQNFEEVRNYPKRRITLTAGFIKPLDELQLSKFINETESHLTKYTEYPIVDPARKKMTWEEEEEIKQFNLRKGV